MFKGRNIKNAQTTFGINDVNNIQQSEMKSIYKNWTKFSQKDLSNLIKVAPKFIPMFVEIIKAYQNTQNKVMDAMIENTKTVLNTLETLSKSADTREEREHLANMMYQFGKENNELLAKVADSNSKSWSGLWTALGIVGLVVGGAVMKGLVDNSKSRV